MLENIDQRELANLEKMEKSRKFLKYSYKYNYFYVVLAFCLLFSLSCMMLNIGKSASIWFLYLVIITVIICIIGPNKQNQAEKKLNLWIFNNLFKSLMIKNWEILFKGDQYSQKMYQFRKTATFQLLQRIFEPLFFTYSFKLDKYITFDYKNNFVEIITLGRKVNDKIIVYDKSFIALSFVNPIKMQNDNLTICTNKNDYNFWTNKINLDNIDSNY